MINKLFPRHAAVLSYLPALLLTLLATLPALAQTAADPNAPAMADGLRADGKIYVVVAVVALIVGGLLLYLITLDRKVRRLEREMKP